MISQKFYLIIGFLTIIFLSLVGADFLAPLSNRLTEGQIITIRGKTSDSSADNETNINLQCGDCNWISDNPTDDSCDIILHFVPRFSTKTALRDSYTLIDGWLGSESWGGFPFDLYAEYEINIIIHDQFLELKVNGKYFCTYKSPLSLDKVNHIRISSITELKDVYVTDNDIREELANIL